MCYTWRDADSAKEKSSNWRPLYLCGWPNLPWRTLPDLSWASRHLHLMGYAALRRVGL